MLKRNFKNFFSKNKNFRNALFEYIYRYGCPFVTKFNHCNFWFDLIFFIQFDLFSLIQCNRLTTIQTLIFNLILKIFIQFNPLFFIQCYWDEVVNLFYLGEYYVNTCVAYEISKIDNMMAGKSVIELIRLVV